jgi:hypothetical protein
MSRNASAGLGAGTPSLQCYATPRLHQLANEAALAKGISTSGLLRLALVEYIARLGLRDGLAEELRTEALSRRSFRCVPTVAPAELHAPATTVPLTTGEG